MTFYLITASVSYQLLNKTVDKSLLNVSCGSTLVKIDVFYPPSFTIKREPQFGYPILQGMTVVLGCDVDANPLVNATGWLKNEKQLNNSGSPGLTLKNVDIKDVGWYQCTTKYLGESYSSIGYFLNVRPAFDDEATTESVSHEASQKG